MHTRVIYEMLLIVGKNNRKKTDTKRKKYIAYRKPNGRKKL